MNPVITFFPVCNGDMTLIQLESTRSILIDCNIRRPVDGVRDVVADLRDRLRRDEKGRPYVDAMLLTHPDQDHCRGLAEHFHLGPISTYATPKKGEPGKILIREMWSSPMVFRRKPNDEVWCPDALAWREEARRRANLFKAKRAAVDGDRIQLMGEDETAEKTKGLETVLVKAGETIHKICGMVDGSFKGYLLAPKGKGNAADEERRSKNHSSVIIRFTIATGTALEATKYLAGGDAYVGIWDRIWDDHGKNPDRLQYHILGAPHHCSWRSLSEESWSKTYGRAKASEKALKALGQALSKAFVVASSKEVKNDYDDPPCIGAKREYDSILAPVGGTFVNTATHKKDGAEVPLEFEVKASGPVKQPPGSRLGIDKASTLTAAANPAKTELAPTKQRGFA